MSLHDIAKHVQSQGRGQDTVLVHMTPNEVGGLQALAKAHGGSLTRNPQTGLYEAGFLSSVLPIVAGVAASAFLGPEMLPLIAGGIGLADYAMTGSLQQGLMAGLGAWSGGSLASGLAEAGAEGLAQQGGDLSAEAFKESQTKALEAAGGDEINRLSAQELAKTQIQAMPNLTAEQVTNMTNASLTNANAADVVRGAGMANAVTGVSPASAMASGFTSPSAWGQAIMENKGAAAGIAAPLLLNGTNLFGQKTLPTANTSAVTTVNQPLQRLSPNYKGSATTTPTEHYQATYPNYVQTPYNPYTGTPAVQSPGATTYAADGGLMQDGPANVDFMGGDMYPTSQQHRSYYATPTQMPTSAQATMASYEPKTNPLTGQATANMAEGGKVKHFDLGGFLESAATGPAFHAQQAVATYQQHPEQAAMGINTPAEAYAWNKATGSQYEPTVNMYGGPTQEDYAKAQQQNVNMSANRVADAAAPAVIGYINPALGAAAAVSNKMGNNYETNLMRAKYANDPNGFTQEYGYVRGINQPNSYTRGGYMPGSGYAEGGITSLADGGNTADHIYHPSYTNYQQTPYSPQATMNPAQLQAATSAYTQQGIPTPTRATLAPGATPGIAGYAINPMKMIGSPAYQAEQDRIAAEKAAQDAQNASQYSYGPTSSNDGGAAGGLMPRDLGGYAGGGLTAFAQGSKDAVGNKDMAAIDAYTAQAREEGGLAAIKDAADKGDWNAMLALQKLGYKASGGGISTLGSYSDGGRLLKGPGDGVSDDIPAQIGQHQPAKLADGEFVVPARIVSELGNGSTDAGAKRLYAMMEKVQAKRKKSIGKGKFAVNSKAENDLPA